MEDVFMEISKREKNENTALILMLGVLSEKLTEIINLLQTSNKLAKEVKEQKENIKKEIVIIEQLTPEDYMS